VNIVYTGSTGFIGNNLVSYLQTKHSTLKCLSRFDIENNHFESIATTDVIIHLAGKAHDLKNISFSSNYYEVNTELTKKIFDLFLLSKAQIFITISTVKAVADNFIGELTEDVIPNPITHYGKSKLLAEKYILSKEIPTGKRVFILRPCMIHGPGNKGNLNLLYNLVDKGFPWPLGLYENKRSFCSIENLIFIIKEIVENFEIQSGVYNIADDETISTNDLIKLIARSQGKSPVILKIPKFIVNLISRLGDLFGFPFNSEKLNKLTQSYIVSNWKIKNAIKKPLPVTTKNGLILTLNSFKKNV
jgi:nucleoside-diphosphate-sugar epimerase